jgi:hypothetical protein
MSFWFVGEEEHADPRFTTGSLGLYVRAGSWCMSQVRYRPVAEIPPEWFVPDWLVRGWGSTRWANDLAQNGMWESVVGGWRYAWIRWPNTPTAMRQERKRQATKKARQRGCPPGTYTGDMER